MFAEVMDRTIRALIAIGTGVVTFVATSLLVIPAGCADVGGVPSWQRCTTILGTPAFSVSDLGLNNSFEVLIPLLGGLLAGTFTWLATGPSDHS